MSQKMNCRTNSYRVCLQYAGKPENKQNDMDIYNEILKDIAVIKSDDKELILQSDLLQQKESPSDALMFARKLLYGVIGLCHAYGNITVGLFLACRVQEMRGDREGMADLLGKINVNHPLKEQDKKEMNKSLKQIFLAEQGQGLRWDSIDILRGENLTLVEMYKVIEAMKKSVGDKDAWRKIRLKKIGKYSLSDYTCICNTRSLSGIHNSRHLKETSGTKKLEYHGVNALWQDFRPIFKRWLMGEPMEEIIGGINGSTQ